MLPTNLDHAEITNLDKKGPPIKCLFNPKEYAFTKTNQWKPAANKATNVPSMEFGGGDPASLTMQLFFDTYDTKDEAKQKKDVRKEYTDAIWELMMIDPTLKDKKATKGRPPKVHFQWGKAWSFDAVIKSLKQNFTLFLPDGTPVRATLDVTFQQVKDAKLFPKQNPTSGGDGGERVWTVNEGDSLAWIAYKEYGDATQWKRIADANRLAQVRRLPPGMVLEIPNG
jgi:phage tail protein X